MQQDSRKKSAYHEGDSPSKVSTACTNHDDQLLFKMKIGSSSGPESKSSKRKVIPKLKKPQNKQNVDEETQGILED